MLKTRNITIRGPAIPVFLPVTVKQNFYNVIFLLDI